MDKKVNVLVFPNGAESALEIHLALKDVMNIRLVGASKKVDHGRMVYANHHADFPNIAEENFYEELNKLIEKENIDLILPTHDTVIQLMARNLDKIKTKVAIPGLWQAEVCRSKKKLYKLFENHDFNPRVFWDVDEIKDFPIYAKLDEGQGSKGAFIVHSRKELDEIEDLENYVLMEYLPGGEITIDCFTDRHGRLQFMGPRSRIRTYGGVSVQGTTVPLTEEISRVGQIVSDTLKIRGTWYFQLKKDEKGVYKFLEASVKGAGNMNVYRGQGVNFPLLMVYDYLDYDVEVIHNDYSIEFDRALFSRYNLDLEYDTIYIDFDDTITKEGKVNQNVMMFIYHQINKGRTLKLITKHRYNLDETLESLAIHKGLFDEIIHIDMEDNKYKYIKEKERVIFIDNAFGERMEIKKKLNIPVFDVDALSFLIDWRE